MSFRFLGKKKDDDSYQPLVGDPHSDHPAAKDNKIDPAPITNKQFLALKEQANREAQPQPVQPHYLAGQPFFLVGEPICIRRGAIKTLFQKNFLKLLRKDADIPDKEIIKSFPQAGKVRLFVDEADALHYLHKKATGKSFYTDSSFAQPAIFSVRCSLVASDKLEGEYCHRDGINKNGHSFHLGKHIRFYQVELHRVTAVSGTLKVRVEDDQSYDFPSVDMRFQPSHREQSSCSIM